MRRLRQGTWSNHISALWYACAAWAHVFVAMARVADRYNAAIVEQLAWELATGDYCLHRGDLSDPGQRVPAR